MTQRKKKEIIKCDDCYAHYPIGNLHICDPLMKALVTLKRNNSMTALSPKSLPEILEELRGTKAYRELLATKFGKKLTHNLEIFISLAYSQGKGAGESETLPWYKKDMEDAFDRGYNAGKEEERDEQNPMGMGQWKAYGEKYFYWEYYEKERFNDGLQAAVEALPEEIEYNEKDEREVICPADFRHGFNLCLSQSKANIKKLKK